MSLTHHPALRAVETGAMLAYPLAVHGAVMAERPRLALGVLAVVSLLHLAFAVIRGSRAGMATAILLGTLAGAGLLLDKTHALFLPPIGIALVFFLLFARTLLPGREPLVTRIARALGDEGEEIARYTRAVTWIWSGFFLLLALESLLLALYAPLPLWSLFTNLLNYLFVALLFVAEWLFRRHRFRHRRTAGWRDFGRADWGALLR